MKTVKRAICTLFLFVIVSFLLIPTAVSAAASDSKAGIVTTASTKLNVRSAASTGAARVASLSKGSYVTLISQSGDWWKVEYAKGKYGYCHGNYIRTAPGSAATVRTQSTALNVRSGAGTSYSRTGSVEKGETVIVLSNGGGWSKVLYNGTKTGYVSSQYLSTAYPAVAVTVPNFKQTDSRWSGVLIGESGKTMAQIGCATTAIAMMESHRTGTTIYPDAMAQRLTYTPSGSVYWPTEFVAVTNAADYLSGIYTQLKQGKPVLLGLKNASGKQHWVVVTGFTGGSSLTASNFTIHDPGSNSRVNLQQLLDLYPVFYKYFYYK